MNLLAGAFRRYWDAVVEPLIADAGPLAGKSLKYLHTDSWEVEVANWTPLLREEIRKRRGYDLLPWLPVITGRILNSRDESERFLNDFRRTFGDLAIDHHYKLFREGAHKHGLLIHPESGGPHAVPIDAQRCLGFNDAPMSEFWAWSWRHRVGESNRFFLKQPASAAHTYGHRLVLCRRSCTWYRCSCSPITLRCRVARTWTSRAILRSRSRSSERLRAGFGPEFMRRRRVSGDHKPRNLAKSTTVE